VKTSWFKGLTGEAKTKRIKDIMGHRNAFDDLKEILEQNYRKKPSVRDYDVPNWEHRQIAVNEYNQCLDDLLQLITLTKG
jgi:hypothetical protein